MIQLLSTKILSPKQKEILQSSGIQLTEYNAIDIEYKDFIPEGDFDHYIFTSQNAARSFLRAVDKLSPAKRENVLEKRCFCVGEKTSSLLNHKGLKIIKTSKNSSELGYFIAKSFKNDSFLFFCGNRRRRELPDILSKYTIRYEEKITYNTIFNTEEISGLFDGVLFYSPSGVQSYVSRNDLKNITAFCIGETTAAEAVVHTNKVFVAENQTIESVVKSALTHFISKQEQ
ncbi:MAG: uroporphyrinogen-III synthase [Flavobacteriaceae bacterium]